MFFFGWCPVFRDVFNVFEIVLDSVGLCEGVPVVFVVNVSVLAWFFECFGRCTLFQIVSG